MYPHLPDGDRSGYGADFYHADRSYHQHRVFLCQDRDTEKPKPSYKQTSFHHQFLFSKL
jgi:hypothetical protein